MKEHNKNRLAMITGRYASRLHEKAEVSRRAFEAAFREAADTIIVPVLEEVAAELSSAGHTPVIERDKARETPSVELAIGLGKAPPAPGSDRVAFSVIERRGELFVLAYLIVLPPPVDIVRFTSPSEITREEIEQIVVDAVEHIFSCHSI